MTRPPAPSEPLVAPGAELTLAEETRYARHLTLPEIGRAGQRRLKNARVLVVGAGGLGSPILLYLAAAGVGTLGIVDPDMVDESNLQRQVIHGVDTIGRLKVDSAAARVAEINPLVEVITHPVVLTSANALELLDGYDLVLDGTDNFATRYLVNDACALLDIPDVWGSILSFDGQVSVFWERGGTGVTYRDVHPVPPPPGSVQNCAEAGVLGMLCGAIGSAMAIEAVKLICGIGSPLLGRIGLFSALDSQWTFLDVRRDPHRAPVTELIDYQEFCGVPRDAGGVSVAGLDAVRADGHDLVDIREDDEVTATGLIPGAVHLPMGRILADPAAAARDLAQRGAQLDGAVLYCAGGVRSARVRDELLGAGITTLSLNGGYRAWDAEQVER